ncbi:Putative membrane protein [Actinoplanes sp. N902-109]|nr:Putative membrane protein [Actinoplanes sp. N902-109]
MKKVALVIATLLVVALAGPPIAAYAAVGPINTTAQGARISVNVLGGLLPVTINLPDPARTWTTGGATSSASTLGATVPGVLNLGAVNASAGPVSGGGTATSGTAGLSVLSALSVGAVQTSCTMSASTISTTTDIANLTVAGAPVNPDVNLAIGVPGVLTGTVDERTATYSTSTGRLSYTVRALDLTLLEGGPVVNGSVIVGESTCSGIVKLGAINRATASVAPGETGTPKVTVTNTGDIAAPGTTIRIPRPPAGYTLGTPTVGGGGTCTTDPTTIICTGVTVPGSGSVDVSLPVSLAASATTAADWAPGSGTITAVSTPITGVTTTISVTGGGTLVNRLAPRSTGGSITVTPMTVAAGKSATTSVVVSNDGPSDATTTVTIPLAGKPAGISIVSATAGGTACTVDATAVTCSNVTVPGEGSTTISLRAAATTTTAPGTTWTVTGMAATLNGTPISGSGRVLTVSDPDVNLDAGVTITPATAVPGDGTATPTVRVRNLGIIPATGTTITLPAPPAGYTVGTVTTTGGGTCTSTGGIRCTGVTVPATGSVTVSIPVTLAAGVTAGWSAPADAPVTATSGDSTGTATGAIVTADPRWTLGASATGPAARTVRPGQTATMTVTVRDNGPSDARAAGYVIVAPQNTTFGPLTGTAAACTQLSPTTVRCTQDIPAAGPAVTLTLPLAVSAGADPAVPVTGGCVSLDNDTGCGGSTDVALPAIQLRTPIANRLTVTTGTATVVPGRSGTGTLTVGSTQDEDDLTVTVPVDGLPTGFTAGTATGPAGSSCTTGTTTITCTGVDISAGRSVTISVPVTLASSVTPPATWTAGPITVSDGTEQLTTSGALATAGTPVFQLTATVAGPPDNTVEPGQTTALSLTARNNGPSDAPATSFGVIAPTGTTFGTPTGAAATACTVAPDGASATCTVTLAAGASSPQLTLPVGIPAGADVSTPIGGGCVDLDTDGTCGGDPDVRFDPIMLKVPFAQQVSVTGTPATVTPGAGATATLTVNAVHGDLSDLTVTVPLSLPTGLTVTGANIGGTDCPISGGQLVCTGVDIENGSSAAIAIEVSATAATAQGTSWTATGITVSNGTDTVTATQPLATVGAPSYRLDTTVTVPPQETLQPGQGGTLGVQVDNLGPSDATAATIGVLLPPGATFGALSGTTDTACDLTGTTHATCTFDLTAAGAPLDLAFPFVVDPGADPNRPLRGGCIDLDADGVCGPGDPAITDIWLATPLSQIVTIGTDPGTVVPGRSGTGTVTVQANRPQQGLTVSIPLDGLPAGFTAPSATVAGGTCDAGPAAITCTGVDLAEGVRKDITVQVAVAADVVPPQTWTATAITVTDGVDSVTANGPIASAGDPATDVSVTVTGPAAGTVAAGSTTTLTLVAANAGPSDAPGRTFTVSAPHSTTFAALTGDAASRCQVTAGNLTVSCTVDLPAGTSTPDLVLPLVVDPGADPFVALDGGCVNLSGTTGCSGPGDVPIDPIQLKVPFDRRAQLVTAAATVTPGTEETATAGVTALHGELSDLTLTIPLDAVPAGLSVTTADAACTTSATRIVCTGLDVPDQQTAGVTLRVRATAAVAPGTTWTATGVTVTADAGNQLTGNPQLATVGPPQATLDATVTQPDPPILPGGTGTLTVDVTNLGPSDLARATIGIDVPTGSTLGTLPAGTAAVCTADPAGTSLTCTFPLAADAGPRRIDVPLSVPPTADPGQPLPGGCVDLNNDDACTEPPDVPMPGLRLATPFNQQVSISTTPATITPGRFGRARVVVASDRDQAGLTIVVPVGDKPADVFIGTPTVAPSGTCTGDDAAIRCTGVDIAAGAAATVTIPLAVTAAAPAGQTWTATGITVSNPGGDSATGSGVLLRTGTPSFRLTGTSTGPDAGTVLPGGTAELAVTLDNTGPSDAVNAPVRVTAPAGTTFGELTGSAAQNCTAGSATTLSCRVTLAATDQPLTWTLPVLIPVTADPAVAITGGCADLDGDGACGGTDDLVLPDISLRAPLGSVVTVSAGNPAVTPGTTGTATVSVAASQARTGLTITIDTTTLPAGLTVTGAGAGCTLATGTVTCTGVDIAGGGTFAVPLTLSATPGADPAGWTPAVTVSGGGETVTGNPAVASIGAPVHPLSVDVDPPLPGTLLPGGTGTLGVTLTNAGPSLYRQARVQFVAPSGTTFGALADPAASFCTATATLVGCTADLPAGDRTFALTLLVPGTADPDDVLDDGCADLDLDGACTSPPDTYFPPIQLATPLSSAVQVGTDPGTAVPGGPAAAGYVTADADRAVTGLTATVPTGTLPAGFTIATATGPGGSPCAIGTDVITCTGVDLTTGIQRVITVTVTAAAGLGTGISWTPGPITLTAADGQTTRTTGTLISTGNPVAPITYTTTTTAGTTEPGATTTLTVTVRNAGPSDATGVTTSVIAPRDTTFGELTGQAASNCTATGSTRLDCRFDLTATAQPLVWTIPVLVAADADPTTTLGGGCLDTGADGTCDRGDPALPGIPLRRTLGQAITVTADDPTIVPGRTGTATVTVRAADARTGLSVTVPFAALPAGVSVTAARQGSTDCVIGTADLTCSGIDLAAGASTGIALTVATTAAAAPGAVWSPAVSIGQAGAAVTRTVDAATLGAAGTAVTVTVVPPAAGSVLPGGTGTLAVTVANSGPSDAVGYPLTFTAPDNTTFGTPTLPSCAVSTAGTTVTCTVDVAAAAAVRFTLPITVAATAPAGTPLGGGCVGTGSATCTPIPPIELGTPLSDRVQLSTTGATVTPGSTATATVRATSTSAVTGGTVTLPLTALPAGLTVTPAGSGCTQTSTAITCTGVDLTAGTRTVLTVRVTATAALRAGVTWTATGITLTSGGETATGSGTLATTGAPSTPFTVAVSGPTGSVLPGDILTMTATVTNPGPSDAVGATATVTAPTNSTFGALSGPVATDCTAAGTTTLSCRFDQIAGTARTWTIPVVVSATAGFGDVVGTGCVTVTGGVRACGDTATVSEQASDRPVSTTATVTLTPGTIPAGTSGTASIALTSTVDQPDLTLAVPLAGLPTGMTVDGASLGDTDCTVSATTITCADIALIGNQTVTVEIAVTAAATVAAGATWTATDVRLFNPDTPADYKSATGTLVTTTAPDYTVTAAVGTPSIPRPAPGQTTVLPITLTNSGPQDANPYTASFVLPTGTSHGPLPTGCAEGATARIVTCTVALAAGESSEFDLPLVVDSDAAIGSTISGGCFDGSGNGTCGSADDLALPSLTVSAPTVDLDIDYSNPRPSTAKGATVLLRLPYSNNGSQSADDVSFLIDPPAGTTLTRAAVLLDASAADFTATATATDTVDIDCEPAPDVDANAARCTGPEAAVGASSELWLYLAIAKTARAGTYPVAVTISTTSPEGNTVNNTATAQLTITGATDEPGNSDNGTGDDGTDDGGTDDSSAGSGSTGGSGGTGLAKTGQDLTGLILLAVLMIIGGGAARVATRNRRSR